MEWVEHMYFNFPFAQQVWRYVSNIIWQLFAKRDITLALGFLYNSIDAIPFSSTLQQIIEILQSHLVFLDEWSSVDYWVLMECFCFEFYSMASGENTPSCAGIFI